MQDFLNNLVSNEKIYMAITLYLVAVQAIKGVRDAIDKTPDTDDNIFERIASVLVKTAGYLVGIRPKK